MENTIPDFISFLRKICILSLLLQSCVLAPPRIAKSGPDGSIASSTLPSSISIPESMKQRASFLAAMDLSLRGEFQESIALWKTLYEENPQDSTVKKNYALDLLRNSQIEEAIAIFEGLDLENDQQYQLILAGAYMTLFVEQKTQNGNEENLLDYYKKANRIYEKLSSVPTNPFGQQACIIWGKAKATLQDYNSAIAILETCLKRYNEKMEIYYYLGKYYQELQNIKKATHYFQLAKKENPNNPTPIMHLAKIYEQSKQNQQAIDEYEEYLKSNPNDKIVLTKLIQLLSNNNKDTNNNKVFFYMEQLSGLDENDLNLMIQLGLHYLEKKQYDLSIQKFQTILQKVPSSEKVLFYLGYIYQIKNDLDKTIYYLEKIGKQSELYSQAILTLAQAKVTKMTEKFPDPQALDDAIEYLTELMQENPKLKIEFQVMLASVYEVLENYSKAVSIMEEIVYNGQNDVPYQYYLATLYDKNKQLKESLALMKIVLSKEPNNPHALNFMGYSLLEQGVQLEQSLEYISKAVKLLPNDGFIRDSLGWYYYKTAQFEKALKELKIAFIDSEKDTIVSKHLALTYKSLKNYDMAYECLEWALKKTSGPKEKEEIEALFIELDKVKRPLKVMSTKVCS